MAVILVCVDVVKDYQWVPIETGGDGLSCPSIDHVKEGLEQKGGLIVSKFAPKKPLPDRLAVCETSVFKCDLKQVFLPTGSVSARDLRRRPYRILGSFPK